MNEYAYAWNFQPILCKIFLQDRSWLLSYYYEKYNAPKFLQTWMQTCQCFWKIMKYDPIKDLYIKFSLVRVD